MRKVLLVLVLVVLAFGTTTRAELLTSPGFESGIWPGTAGYASGSTNWWVQAKTGDGLARSGSNYLRAGSYYYYGWGGYAINYQDVAATAGTAYTFSAYFMDDWGGLIAQHPDYATKSINGILKLEFLNAAMANIGTAGGNVLVGKAWDQGWQLNSISGVAPVDTAWVRAVVGENGINSSVRVDDVSMTPEPMTLALLGAGGLFLRRRK